MTHISFLYLIYNFFSRSLLAWFNPIWSKYCLPYRKLNVKPITNPFFHSFFIISYLIIISVVVKRFNLLFFSISFILSLVCKISFFLTLLFFLIKKVFTSIFFFLSKFLFSIWDFVWLLGVKEWSNTAIFTVSFLDSFE